MKKIISVFFILAVIFTFAGCSNTAANNRSTSSKPSDVSKNYSTNDHNKSQTVSAKETTNGKTYI
jgi:predicted small lipoprotein YifL